MEPLAADDPRQVGGYRLLRRLGAGGMGRVYLGRSTGGRTVAVKVVRRDLAGDAEFRARFRQEVAAARRVGGTWTPPVLDADTGSGQPWVATGYVAGPALTTAVREFGPLPEPAVRTLGVGLAAALAHVHGLGLVHRDVKPSNVLLTLDGPRLIDFGIARALDATSALTRSGQVFGSPGFMSPEQANGLPAGPAGDVFSLGAVLAYAASGTMPFGSGVSAPVLLYRVLHEEPDLSGLAGPLYPLVRDCLAKDPAARPTPALLRERLDPDGAAAARLGHGHWLPPALAAAVGRSAVQLLDLEGERTAPAGADTGSRMPAGLPGAAPGGGAPAVPAAPPGSGPPAPGFGPPAAGPAGPAGAYGAAPPPAAPYASAPYASAPHPSAPYSAPFPTPPGPVAAPGHGPYSRPPRRRRGYGVVAAVLAVVLLLGGGYLLIERLGDDGARTAAAGERTAPAAPPAPAATGPGPEGSPTDRTGQGAVPAEFLGTWAGRRTAEDGAVTTVTLRILQSARGEEKSTIRAETPKTGIWCEGAWTLSEAGDSRLTYASRTTDSSPGAACITDRSVYRQVTMQPDGTLHYSTDLLAPNQYVVLQKLG
ncbi:serine/threonine-protein kinase [Kitasatospora sp. NPDC015120]|uniref:serine/threonine-protein kinase n=1 Tax=Kitasatospora sp. NPDC015120 TaxID=3364023 RepID=UPI0036F45EEA